MTAEQPAKSTKQQKADDPAKIATERERNAKSGFFYTAALYILSRFPLTKNRYQNWTRGRRILVGWLLWLVTLPIIPMVAIIDLGIFIGSLYTISMDYRIVRPSLVASYELPAYEALLKLRKGDSGRLFRPREMDRKN